MHLTPLEAETLRQATLAEWAAWAAAGATLLGALVSAAVVWSAFKVQQRGFDREAKERRAKELKAVDYATTEVRLFQRTIYKTVVDLGQVETRRDWWTVLPICHRRLLAAERTLAHFQTRNDEPEVVYILVSTLERAEYAREVLEDTQVNIAGLDLLRLDSLKIALEEMRLTFVEAFGTIQRIRRKWGLPELDGPEVPPYEPRHKPKPEEEGWTPTPNP